MSDAPNILHVDMDAFFASVEQRDDPALRGKPVLVGHDRPRGVVAAASYEARAFGCHSAQPMAVARRLCPQAVVVPGDHHRYAQVSAAMFDILNAFTPQIEPLSIDEAFLDVSGSLRLHGDAVAIARRIRQRIAGELQLTASVGVAPNKFLAKLASDMNKPDGLTIIRREDIDTVLPPLPIGRIWGIGPKTAQRLDAMNIRTIGDLRRLGLPWMQRYFGRDAEHYHRLALGIDDRRVTPDSEARQISQETTFVQDLSDPEDVRSALLGQVEQVAQRLRRHGLSAAGVSVKIRYGPFKTITRSATLAGPSDITSELWQAALTLFNAWAAGSFQPVRLIGMAAGRLTREQPEATLFTDAMRQKQQQLDQVLDQINQRMGTGAIRRGR